MAKEPVSELKPEEKAFAGMVGDLQKAGLGTMMGVSKAWVEAMSDMGAEFMQFVAARVQEDVKAQHEILHCKSMTELQEIQTNFMKKAIEQYQAETGKMVELSTSAFTTMAEVAKKD